jgi:hypothetical protein
MAGAQAIADTGGEPRNSGVSRMSSGRSAGRSDSMMSVTRPGRGDITTILVER